MIDNKYIPVLGLVIAIGGYLAHYTTYIDLNSDIADTGFPVAFVFIFILGVCLFIYLRNMREIPTKKQQKCIFCKGDKRRVWG